MDAEEVVERRRLAAGAVRALRLPRERRGRGRRRRGHGGAGAPGAERLVIRQHEGGLQGEQLEGLAPTGAAAAAAMAFRFAARGQPPPRGVRCSAAPAGTWWWWPVAAPWTCRADTLPSLGTATASAAAGSSWRYLSRPA